MAEPEIYINLELDTAIMKQVDVSATINTVLVSVSAKNNTKDSNSRGSRTAIRTFGVVKYPKTGCEIYWPKFVAKK